MKPHVFQRQADDEYAEGLRYYAEINAKLGQRFYFEVERCLREICLAPQRHRLFEQDARRYLCKIFPYAIVYRDQPDRVIIVAVMHLRRRPGYWLHRLD